MNELTFSFSGSQKPRPLKSGVIHDQRSCVLGYYDKFKYPDVSEESLSGYSENVKQSIGEVVVWFEDLDTQLSSAISFLLKRDDTVGQIVTAELSFKSKVNLFGVLFRQERPSSEDLERLEELCGACFQIEALRNQVVHSKWLNVLEGTGMVRSKYTARHKKGLKHQTEVLTPNQVESIAMHCGYISHAVDELMFMEFGEDYGEP